MSLQWYPGHMTKARRELAALMPSQDVVIEVLDARLPAACSNPVIAELRGNKPVVKVLTKRDLADQTVTEAWVKYFAAQPNTFVVASSTTDPAYTRKRITQICQGMAAHRGAEKKPRALIAGVPNVGKSTLINTLMNQLVAKVSDKPAVTKEQKRVVMTNGMTITDSPGLMWPKIEDEVGALRLALAGSIPDTAIDYYTVGMFGAALFLERYGDLMVRRYKLPQVPDSAEGLLFEVGKRRGGLRAGGKVDLHTAAEILVHEFRAGTLGEISLELPPEAEPEILEE
jgi:ribosome biogenesis GTPase A